MVRKKEDEKMLKKPKEAKKVGTEVRIEVYETTRYKRDAYCVVLIEDKSGKVIISKGKCLDARVYINSFRRLIGKNGWRELPLIDNTENQMFRGK